MHCKKETVEQMTYYGLSVYGVDSTSKYYVGSHCLRVTIRYTTLSLTSPSLETLCWTATLLSPVRALLSSLSTLGRELCIKEPS